MTVRAPSANWAKVLGQTDILLAVGIIGSFECGLGFIGSKMT